MKGLGELIKTTLIGGLLVVLPIYLSILLLAKTLAGVLALLAPVTAAIPASAQFRQVVAVVIVLAVCLVVGFLVRTNLGLRAMNALERSVLEKIPGYTLVRGLTKRVSGDQSEAAFQPALVELEDALAPAFIIEELEDDRYTVLVPSVPTPAAGSLYILPRHRVHPVDMPFTHAVRIISKWGVGAGALARGVSFGSQSMTTGREASS